MTDFYKRLCEQTERERQDLVSIPVIQRALLGQIDRHQYLAFLTQAYHHVRHTVPLLMALGSRLSDRHAWLQKAVAEYIEEEVGHEHWILNDIRAVGGDPDAVRMSRPDFSTEVMVSHAYHLIDRRNPLGFFGMVHVLEGTSIALASLAAEKIADVLSLPPQAFSYLNSHGSLDLTHVKFFETLMNQVEDPQDQDEIIHAAGVFYRLYGNVFRSLPQTPAPLWGDTEPAEAPVTSELTHV
ncbi:MAG: TenA family transcriptional regulator [Burkholderiaceae bacterium]|jgi:pyrroloquinoline quinone (PQQ) biosynthesis protein C